MRAIGLVRSVLPRPRRRVSAAAAVPLVAFLAAYAGVCVGLELSDTIMFAAPGAFALAVFLPWLWWMHVAGASGLRGPRWLVALLVRLAVAGVLIAALAEPRAVRKNDALSVVYALDVSDSIGSQARDDGLRYVTKTVAAKPERDRAGLVVFGRDAAVELPPRESFPLEAINSRIETGGTDVGQALSLAAAVLPEDAPGRIVLISDGAATQGSVAGVVDDLKSRGIPVDVVRIRYEYADEVWVEKLELPRFVRVGETYEASVVVSSLRPGSGTLVLQENGRVVYEGGIEYGAGKSRFTLPIQMREPGYYEYAATVRVPEGRDGWAENNTAIGHLNLRGEGKVLVVTDPGGDARDWQSLVQALARTRFAVEVVTAYEMPSDVLSLQPYDCIVFPNVPADAFDVVQLEAVRNAVNNQGTGFLMVGGPQSFGPGGYQGTAVEQALPVSMDVTQRRVMPKGALVIILHTCEFPEGNTWGKRVAKQAIRVLSAQDEVGALAYGYQGREGWLFPLSPAGEYERLALLINQAEIGDMPSFANTMQMGLAALQASDAAAKHMIIVSDGDPSPPTPQLLAAFAQAQVSVSTVCISPHGPQDAQVMQGIAQATGGRYYLVSDPRRLPSIFIKEAKTLRRTMIQNVPFVPEFGQPSPIMKGIVALPQLGGYVLTTPKPRSLTVLETPGEEQRDPVLATWNYGIGRSAAFTSDLSPNWGSEWVGWDQYEAFVRQLLAGIGRVELQGHLQTRVITEGGEAALLVEDTAEDAGFLDARAAVQGPSGEVQTLRLRQTGPGRYEGRFPLPGRGRYQVVVTAEGDGRSEQATDGLIVAYSPEYLRFRADPIALRRIAEGTGGRLLSGDAARDDVFPADRRARSSSRPVPDLFLFLLACLVPLDVGVRRVQLDWALIKGWFVRERAPSSETLEALLSRKKQIEFVSATEIEARRRAPIKPPAEQVAAAQGQVEGAEPQETEGMTTTERLLARRKKWKQEE